MAAIIVLAVGVVVAGCGGDDDELTKSEFTTQANAICEKGNAEIDSAANKAFPRHRPPSEAEATNFAEDTLIPNVQRQIDDVRDLNPPSEDEDEVTAILDEAQQSLDRVEDDPTILFGAGQSPFAKSNQLAKAYGLDECASD